MKRLTLIAIAGGVLLAVPALAQHAVPRGGGSSGGGSSNVGAQHQSPPASAPAPSHVAPSSPSSPSRGLTDAERRHPRAGTGRGSSGGGYYPGYPGWGGGYYPGYSPGWGWYGWGGWYSPYYYSNWYGWPGYWGAPWGAGAVYSYVQSDRGSIRMLVDPPDARVYVDGYYAGVVDDFDGLFQRLHLAPGRHEIEVKLAGYKTYRVRVYVGSGSTLKLDHELEEGTGEEFEDMAGDVPDREARYGRPEATAENAPPQSGELRLRVDPEDASVYVDGAFSGTGRDLSAMSLPPGTHQVEVVRPGFRTEQREVEVRPRDVTEVTIDMSRP